jgi:TrpR-related protein YerC/YecD
MISTSNNQNEKVLEELFEALLHLKNTQEVGRFMKDLCTPQEISALAERWRVCRLLEQNNLSYREIHDITGASLTTIGRVARFLKTEPHQGYKMIIDRVPALKLKNI